MLSLHPCKTGHMGTWFWCVHISIRMTICCAHSSVYAKTKLLVIHVNITYYFRINFRKWEWHSFEIERTCIRPFYNFSFNGKHKIYNWNTLKFINLHWMEIWFEYSTWSLELLYDKSVSICGVPGHFLFNSNILAKVR